MNPIEVNVLGQTYKVYELAPEDGGTMEDGVLGTTDWTTHEIMLRGSIKEPTGNDSLANLDVLYRETLRHEITHAFLFESGMTGSDTFEGDFAHNELMVDWFAMQAPKMLKAFEEADAL
ncbi:MAG: hypothetical protein RSG23_05130 [Gordonibacter sp.]|uniref:hypothetical protein n=1 Tax=Gordonibacter sp. TaxID=1968902 RepID=UPI002FCB7D15